MDLPHIVATVTNNDELEAVIEALKAECPHLAEDKRAIAVIIDNYDTFVDEARALREALPALGALAREHGSDGLHFVVAGSPSSARSPEELRKQLVMPRLGIALQSDDAVSALNGRIPRSLAQAELPMGRGFLVRSGRTFMLQIATPYEDDERQALILDRWVTEIKERHPGPAASWWHYQEPVQEDEEEDVQTTDQGRDPDPAATGRAPTTSKATGAAHRDGADDGDDPSRRPPALLRGVPEGVDVAAVKAELKERGMDDDLLAIMSPVDVVNVAREMKVLVPEGDDE
jgi:hypothetical protein